MKLIFQDEVSVIPSACFILSLFKLYVLLFKLWSRGMGVFPILARIANGRFIRWKCLLFQFLCHRIRFHIPILAEAQNERLLSWKKSYSGKKMFFLKLNFQDESHLHADYLFCILVLYCKCFSFHFSYCGILIHSSVLVGAQTGRIAVWKTVIFSRKTYFSKLNFQNEDQLYANWFGFFFSYSGSIP